MDNNDSLPIPPLHFKKLLLVPSAQLSFAKARFDYVIPESIESQAFGLSAIDFRVKVVRPTSIDPIGIPGPAIGDKDLLASSLNFSVKLTTPNPILNFGGSDKYKLLTKPKGLVATRYGQTVIQNFDRDIIPDGLAAGSYGDEAEVANMNVSIPLEGIESTAVIGYTEIRNTSALIEVEGIAESNEFSEPEIINLTQRIELDGFESLDFDKESETKIFNFLQYVELEGIDSEQHGMPYLQGGVVYVEPESIDSNEFGEPYLVKYIEPVGVDSEEFGYPIISPSILYADGFYEPNFGYPDVRIPSITTDGAEHTSYGSTTVWYHTRELSPAGLLAYESGYPLIADPTQFVFAISLVASASFGAARIQNIAVLIKPTSIFDGAFSDYATLTNDSRRYNISGIDSQVFGSTAIINKTPQLFVDGITNSDTGLPAVGYRITEVRPSGFDHLLLGEPTLTKDPEINVDGFDESEVTEPVITHRARELYLLGIDSSDLGEATVWFGYRRLAPESWQSDEFAELIDISHGFREIISHGFNSDEYGDSWVSYGQRSIEPKAIYDEKLSSHMIGSARSIEPAGYIATLFGERIIPTNQLLQPLGFTTLWGNTTADLYTRYIAPYGYISAGIQPADRWGDAVFSNLTQFIIQEYDAANGLTPPAWSEWTLIENRSKQVNVTSFLSQKFGYSKIDNNAAPLLPIAIAPPVIGGGMISHAIREVALDGIEPPPISYWLAIYNDARVLFANGITHTGMGVPSIENTRRYYSGVGNFESLEAGVPMIAYRIRTIDIETRYSIAPPQIELPVVDLYTRYILPLGYEATKHAMPSLTIHFNIIAPKWVYREKPGQPIVHNVTPTYYAFGHDSEEFGKPLIRTQWREVRGVGDNMALFGAVMIADTKRYIAPLSWVDSEQSYFHEVIRTGTNPYVLQNINLDEEHDGIDELEFGNHELNQNVLYTVGDEHTSFGSAILYSNNITPIGYGIDNVPDTLSVRNKNNVINLAGKGIDKGEVSFGKPRFSHHTIWVTTDTPEQAIENHPGGFFTPIETEQFGVTNVESTIRGVQPKWDYEDRIFGLAEVTLRLRIIQPEPFRLSRFGFPVIPFTPQDIEIKKGISLDQWGDTNINHEVKDMPNELIALGIDFCEFGETEIDNKTRYLEIEGLEATQMGASIYDYDDTPFMWQGLRIGEHVPSSIGAGDMSFFGDTWISLKIREVGVMGFNAFRSQYDLEFFRERMTVKNKYDGKPFARTITTTGFNTSSLGSADAKLGQHYIRPDGNSDQFRKGGHYA